MLCHDLARSTFLMIAIEWKTLFLNCIALAACANPVSIIIVLLLTQIGSWKCDVGENIKCDDFDRHTWADCHFTFALFLGLNPFWSTVVLSTKVLPISWNTVQHYFHYCHLLRRPTHHFHHQSFQQYWQYLDCRQHLCYFLYYFVLHLW